MNLAVSAGPKPIPPSNPIITKVAAPGCTPSNSGFVPLKFPRLKSNPDESKTKPLMLKVREISQTFTLVELGSIIKTGRRVGAQLLGSKITHEPKVTWFEM